MKKPNRMFMGACSCAAVRFKINSAPLVMYHCHCSVCQAASGASFATNIVFAAAAFNISSGADILRYHQSSPGKKRYFCVSCGSPIYSRVASTNSLISVRAGLLKGDPMIRPTFHAYVDSKASWVTITDELPRFAQAPEWDFVGSHFR
jgi:hypothetical protein